MKLWRRSSTTAASTKELTAGGITFTHEIKPQLKRVYIRISRDRRVILRSAPMSEKDAVSIIISKSAWIRTKLDKIVEKVPSDPLLNMHYLGVEYENQWIFNEKMGIGSVKIGFHADKCIFEYNPKMMRDEILLEKLNAFYRKEVKNIVPPLVDKWSAVMGLKPESVTFRKAKSRWGSCSSKGGLSFNIYLAKLPAECIEYVVVHELAHLAHHNHGKHFWALVERYIPNYACLRKSLKQYAV
ncbi:MAG: M48 family metallopeptidase [Deferribacterales bacterium]